MLIGAHESVAGGVSQAFGRAQAHGGECLGIFTKSSRAWSSGELTEDERRSFRRAARQTGLRAIAHGSYLVNLGTEDPALRARSIDCVVEELSRCERLGVKLLVIHPGCHADERTGMTQIARGLDEVHARTKGFKSRICLEVTAGQGLSIGWRFEHLAGILERAHHSDRIGLCLDTCHLHAAGYDLTTTRGYKRVMAELDLVVGLDRVRCFHLNDCKKPLGCRVDRHEEIGKGTIGLTAFRCLVNDERFEDAIGVLETPFAERYGEAIKLLESMRRR
jgi:deoxyribonuclease IV